MQPSTRRLGVLFAYRFRFLASALLVLLLTYPYASTGAEASAALMLLNALVLFAGTYSVSTTRSHIGIALLLATATIAFNWWDLLGTRSGPTGIGISELAMLAEVAFYAYVVTLITARVFQSGRVTADTLAGSVCVYLLIGLCFTSAYVLLLRIDPSAFSFPAGSGDTHPWPNLLFFSFTALTTVGYGNITPASQQACSLATLESCAGVLYTTILVARLVSLYRGEAGATHPEAAQAA